MYYQEYLFRIAPRVMRHIVTDFDLFYVEKSNIFTDSEEYVGDAADALSAVEFISGMREYTPTDFYVYTTYSDALSIARAADAEYCDDIDGYSSEYVFVEDVGLYYHDTYDLYYCDECGRYFTEYAFNVDLNMCDECVTESGADIIGDYHNHKGDYIFFGDDPRRVGIELEIDRGNNARDCARALADIFGNHAYFECDSSLDCGFEIITMPHTWSELCAIDWSSAFETAKEYGFRSHDAGTCGLHIHFAKEWFGDTESERVENIGLMLNFYRRNYETLFRLSRRASDYWCGNDDIYDITPWYNRADNACSLSQYVAYKTGHGSHGTAVNLGNYYGIGTIEFRLGRGTLKMDTFAAWLDIHKAIVTQSKTATDYDFISWINPETVDRDTWNYIVKRVPELASTQESTRDETRVDYERDFSDILDEFFAESEFEVTDAMREYLEGVELVF